MEDNAGGAGGVPGIAGIDGFVESDAEDPFLPRVACEVLMRWGSCLGTRSAEVLRAVFDGQ